MRWVHVVSYVTGSQEIFCTRAQRKIAKACLLTSVRLSVCSQRALTNKSVIDFYKNLTVSHLLIIKRHQSFFLKSEDSKRHLTWRLTQVSARLCIFCRIEMHLEQDFWRKIKHFCRKSLWLRVSSTDVRENCRTVMSVYRYEDPEVHWQKELIELNKIINC